MNRYLRSEPVCYGWQILLAALFLLLTLGAARGVTLVQEFYLPIPEWEVLQACKSVTPSVADTNFVSITAILVTGDGTQIFYDQWEDGYEPNLSSPTNASTLIWGDGIDANGIPPGFAHDPAGLAAGTVLILSNAVASSPRIQSQIFYDGRDRIAATKALVVTRAGWPYPTGPVFGGSAVVQATIDWGTNYVSPIGQDMTENLFKFCGFFVMASQDNTVAVIDPDGPGPLLAMTNVLGRGQSWYYPGGVRRGGTINASKPVEAHLVCGDTVNTYAIDWFTLYPQSDWSSSYYTPLPSVQRGGTLYLTDLYFYNNTATPITIQYTNQTATNSFTLPANGGYKFIMPTNSGAVFASAGGEQFTVLCTVANSSTDDTAYNWGFTPLPKGSLTTEADAGWSPGSSDYTGNGSPVWVTPTAATRIYVDYRGDHAGPLTDPNGGKYDTNFTLVNYQSQRIYVPGTNNDQTGLRIYTLDGTLLSVVWGEDPSVAGSGNPYLDLGNPVLPFPVPRLTKSALILTDAPPAGLSIGDTLLYTVQVDNKGLLPLGNTVVVDAPPPALNYLTNSSTLNGAAVPDSTSGTAFPLDTPGYTIPIILSGGTTIFQYKALIVSTGSVVNTVNIPGYNVNVTNTIPVAAVAPSFFVGKTIITPASGVVGVGQTMQFNLQIINNGNVPLPNVAITDNYPATNFSYVTASLTPNSAGNGQILWTNLGTFAIGQVTNITVTLLATNTATIATNTVIAAAPGNTTNSASVVFTNAAAPTPSVVVNKTLLSPATPKAGIGQTVQFNLQAYNNGFATLTNLSLTDNFPRTNFAFVSASVPPNLITASNLVWTNLGNFSPGQLTNISINFTVTNYSALVTNYGIAAAAGGATNTGSSSLQISRSGLAISKTILSPTNQTVPLGSNVTFRILIQNSGSLAITNLPLEDTFSASLFSYVSATIPPNSIAPGSLYWTNLAGASGLATNVVITNDVTLRVTGGATPAYNTVAANFAFDVNNTPVPPAASSTGVNTAAGSISGKVYSDNDQSGTLTGGDTSLESVTLTLYSDPNGDGNPADGVRLQSIGSDANGYYELLNLNTGAFVVVQTVLPGYTGTAPANNRLAILISSLTAATNQNFFQSQVPAASYATVNGTVWNDVNGVGFYQAGDFGQTNVQVDLVQDLNTNGIVDAGETPVQSTFTLTNGTYNFSAVAPGRYVIREVDSPGYISTGDTSGTNDNQIAVNLGSGVTTNGNDFFDFYFGLGNTNSPPVAVPDFTNTLENVALLVPPLVNDNSPGGYTLFISNVAATNGLASIIGGTNILFTPANYFTGTATVGYTVTNANGASTSRITITVAPVADLRIGKTGAASVLAASNLTYTISVTNFGPAAASSVTITDALPSGVTFVSASGNGVNNSGLVTWSIGTLSSNQVTNVTVTVTAPASGTLTNLASVGSPTTDTNGPNITPPVLTTVTPLADLVIAKTGVASVTAGSSFSYTISVTNLGPSSASSVTVTDALPSGVTFSNATAGGVNLGGTVVWNLGTMTAAQATNLTLTVTAPNNGTTLTNVANVSSPTGDTNVLNNTTPPVITSVTPVADVSVLKTGPAGIIFGTNYNYSITVSNGGPSTAASLIVTDSLPSGLAFVSSVPSTTTNASNQVIWNLGNFAANTASNLTLTVISTQRGSLTNFASGGSPTPDPTPTNNLTPPVVTLVTNFPPLANPDGYTVLENSTNTFSPLTNDLVRNPGGTLSIISVTPTNGTATISGTNVSFTPTNNFVGTATIGYTITDGVGGTDSSVITVAVLAVADVAVSKTGAASVYAATNFDYTITVTNFGPGAAANVSVTDNLPTTVSFVSASAGGTFSAGQVIWVNLGSLAANAATNLTVTVTAPLTSQTLTNIATAGTPTSDPNPTNNVTPPVTTTVTPQADLQIGKVGPATVFAASNLTYTISVTNFGPSSASSVTVTDALPNGVTFVSATGGGATNGSIVSWNLGTLASNQVSSVTVTVTAPASGSLTNTASVSTPTLDPTPTNNVTPPVITTVTPQFDLQIGKTAAASVLALGNLTYTISVTNFGPSSASSVTVTDALPNGVSFVSASGSGVNNLGSVSWSLGTLSSNQVTNVTVTVTAPASGSLTNTASVNTPTGDPNPTNNVTPPVTTTVTPQADLQIGKVGPATVFAASNLTYTISVTNFGPSSASSVTVTDALPNGVTFVSATGGGVTNGNSVSWLLGILASNQVSSVSVTVTAPTSGSLTNTANVNSPTGDPSPTNNVTPPVVTMVTLLADVSVVKVGPAGIIFGTNYNYSLTVSNGGPSTATSLIVTDSLPVGLVFVSSVPSATTNASNQVIWNLGNFAANTASNLTLTVISTQRGSLTNFASGGSPVPDPTPTNNVTPPVVTLITNFPPLANPDSASMTENTTNTVSPLINDVVRTPGGSLTILSVTPTNGVASISGTNVIFVPTLNFIGVATIGYVITDNVGGTNSSVITITVTNIPPLANPDSYAMAENTTNTFSPLVNDTLRTLGGTLSLVSLNPTNGTAQISGTDVVFTPALNFLGTATIGYVITDGIGGTNASVITINVTNRPPVVNPDSYAMTENTTNTLPVLVNDLVVTPGGTLTIISVTPTNGTASISGTNIVFVPTTNFLGTATIGYTTTDGIGGTNSSVATVTVTNIPPLANPDGYTMAENTTNTFAPLTNDVVRTPGGSLIILSVTPTNGAASIIGGTNVTFIPTINFVGVTTIGYTITDGIGGTNSSVITVTVTNQSPIAFPQTLSTTENVALPITLTGTDPVSRPLTFIIVSAPGGGTLTGLNTNTGAVTYTPTNNFTGTDTFVFRVNNGVNNSSNATITISVTPTADLLVQQSGPTSGVAGNNLVFTVAVTNLGPASATNVVVTNQIAAGYTFVSAAGNGATNGSLVTWTIPILPANGATNLTVTLLALEGGTFTNGASGSNATLDLNATNNNGSLTNAQVITTVSASANLAITKTAPANVNATGSLTYNLTVTNGGPSTATGVIVTDALPANVSLVSASGNGVNNSGIVTWNLGTLASGATSNLTVTVNAPASGTLTNFASIGSPTPDPTPTNNVTPPVVTTVTTIADLAVGKAGAASSALGVNFSYTISVTNLGPSTAANFAVTDSLPAGIVFVSAVPSVTTNASSQVIWTNLGTLALNATTNLTLTVKAVTRGAVTNFATVGGPTVDGTPTNNTSAPVVTSITNRPPLAVDDSGSTPKNVGITVPVLVNDSDPDGDALTIISVSPTSGTANIVGTNVVFTPALNFIGTAFIGYTIADGFGGTNSAVITINVTNRPPVANAQSATTTFNTAKPLTLTGSDLDGDTLTFIIVSAPSGGTLTGLNTNTGAVIYTPTNNFTGTDTFTFRVNDGTANSATATVSIMVGTPIIADLAVFKTGPTNGAAGSNLVYSITVTNLGTAIATNVLVSDQLPPGFTFVSATPPGVTVTSNVVTWLAFKLAPNTKMNFTVTAFSLEGGTFTNFATAISDAYDPNPTNNNGSLTNSQARTVIAASADVQVFKDGGTNVAAGSTVNYTITATNAGPSTATNVVVKDNLPAGATFQSASGSYTFSNNVVTWSALTLTNGASVNFTLALTAPASGQFTNIALATSPTPDPNLTNNNGSLNKARVATKIVPVADLIVLLYGPTNAVQGSNFVYSLILSNAGPSVASNAFASDQLPTNFVFVSATSGGVFSNGIVKWPKIAFLNVGGTSNYFITVNSPFTGTFTNIASAISDTLDPNPTNNTGIAPASQALTTVSVADLSWLGSPPIFNPQTGLYEATVSVTNNGNGTIAGFWLYVTVSTSNVYLWNATGTNGGVRYVQYSLPLDPSNHVSLVLEFYDPLRVPFTNTLQVVPVIPANVGGIGTNGSVNVEKVFTDTRTNGTRFVIEFVSVPGKTYTIIYSGDLLTWKVATPSVTANANVTQWYDDGPPKTERTPMSVTNRFYRVIKN